MFSDLIDTDVTTTITYSISLPNKLPMTPSIREARRLSVPQDVECWQRQAPPGIRIHAHVRNPIYNYIIAIAVPIVNPRAQNIHVPIIMEAKLTSRHAITHMWNSRPYL